jgi:hypothetical protein
MIFELTLNLIQIQILRYLQSKKKLKKIYKFKLKLKKINKLRFKSHQLVLCYITRVSTIENPTKILFVKVLPLPLACNEKKNYQHFVGQTYIFFLI